MTTDQSAAGHAVSGAMGPDAANLLGSLRQSMDRAHTALMAARRATSGRTDLERARSDYLRAMVAYQQALAVFRLPVPPRLRDELRLLRRVTDVGH
ncbi:hypothetical protein OO014_10955 [Intrasporangium calvum]|uniref:Uncharacterized protein n=1 Tax=Intrasporangium calvum TaxID=53358 RepID=A0ABT5GIK0_9MICO|nr:hypothetical protein [Intrasporangium calvum]MDC5697781.1 hypothetical protein [Intrasporangium calvum]